MSKPGTTLSLILSFLSGYVDTAVFVHMKGLFVAHVTGNFVLLGATIAGASAEHGGSATLQLIAFPIFFLSAALAAVIAGRVGKDRQTPVLLWLATALIGGVGALAFAPGSSEAVLAMLLVTAMGMLNAAHRMDGTLGPPFTVMTGNVTAVAIETARVLHLARREREGPVGAPARAMLVLVAGFGVGCALGAVAQASLGLGSMVLPAILLAGRLALR